MEKCDFAATFLHHFKALYSLLIYLRGSGRGRAPRPSQWWQIFISIKEWLEPHAGWRLLDELSQEHKKDHQTRFCRFTEKREKNPTPLLNLYTAITEPEGPSEHQKNCSCISQLTVDRVDEELSSPDVYQVVDYWLLQVVQDWLTLMLGWTGEIHLSMKTRNQMRLFSHRESKSDWVRVTELERLCCAKRLIFSIKCT